MDTRLLDDTAHFMNGLNLENRYDQVIFAGSAMGARLLKTPPIECKCKDTGAICTVETPWKEVFFQQLGAAIDVLKREVKDVFILEHLDCGAYKYLHPDPATQKDYSEVENIPDLERFHRKEALAFAEEVKAFCDARDDFPKSERWHKLRVRCFLMDLVGGVKEIVPT
jgi:hypothetical protein